MMSSEEYDAAVARIVAGRDPEVDDSVARLATRIAFRMDEVDDDIHRALEWARLSRRRAA